MFGDRVKIVCSNKNHAPALCIGDTARILNIDLESDKYTYFLNTGNWVDRDEIELIKEED